MALPDIAIGNAIDQCMRPRVRYWRAAALALPLGCAAG